MLAYLWLLAFIGLGSCSELEKVMPSRFEIESSINRTIEEVERLIEENPTLPKLTRNDIVNILYNITSKDIVSLEDQALEAIQKTRADYQRALMVVLPYKLKDTEESLKELYTKPPLVQLVSDEESSPVRDSKIITAYDALTDSAQQSENLVENKHQTISAHMRFDEHEKPKRSEELTTGKSNAKTDSAPHKFTFNLGTVDQKAEASSYTSYGTKRPLYKGTFSRYRTSPRPPKVEITTTTTTQKPTTITEAKIETTTAPTKPTQNILSSDQWHYNAPPTTEKIEIIEPLNDSPWKPMTPSKNYFLPTVESSPDVLKMEDLEKLIEPNTARSAPIFVTPSATTHQKKVNPNVKTVPSGFKLTTTTVSSTPMREEVEVLLKSIGLQPMKPTKQNTDVKYDQNKVESQLNAYFDNKEEQTSKPDILKSNPSESTKDNAFAAPTADIKEGVKNLSPEIQLLFQQFGLPVSSQDKPVTTTTTTTTTRRPVTTTKVNSYTNFKPLPTSSVRDLDFRNFLARFGLGFGDSRNQKAMQQKQPTKRPSLIEAVPANMKKILENIGLIRRAPKEEKVQERKPEYRTQSPRNLDLTTTTTTTTTEHVFKPSEKVVPTVKEQNEKIKNLLHTVKMVQEGKADVQDVQKVAHDLIQSTKSLDSGPDPIKLEEILNNYRNSLKNEVKRQQEQTTIPAAVSTAQQIDDTTLANVASNDSSGSFSELSESSVSTADKSASPSSTTPKGSFFDTFDINAYTDQASSTTAASAPAESTKKPSAFDSIDISKYLENATAGDDTSGKNSNPNVSDLEESFGGSTAEPDPVIPTRPKTGLYFLLDWNSFLEVGEDGKDKVNLKFQPKVGDRTRFISVTVP